MRTFDLKPGRPRRSSPPSPGERLSLHLELHGRRITYRSGDRVGQRFLRAVCGKGRAEDAEGRRASKHPHPPRHLSSFRRRPESMNTGPCELSATVFMDPRLRGDDGSGPYAFFRWRRPRSSAICTALSAAPLRRLSDTHHKARPFSTVGSLRTRLMKVA